MLGITKIMGDRLEGLLNLHRADEISPHQAHIHQALFLGYRTIGNLEVASQILKHSAKYCANCDLMGAPWVWTNLEPDSAITSVAFEENLVLAVEPSFKSIVTSILVGQQDWFEDEMEFWRNYIKPNMTVIDVGANAGVYAFSAANKVGDLGLVLAIEPFSQCVSYLQETCRINNLTQVKVIAAAASDRHEMIKLAIGSASELNQIITEAESANFANYEEVESITLDALCAGLEGLNRVDIIKIDAEGHELQVLRGCEKIIALYAPVIMYENISGTQNSSLPVAEFLKSKGYSFFRYQPYLQRLIPINPDIETQQSLNIIAIKNP
jgi:FkbM family methyltransferase